jgi:hypothetical protein
MSAFVTRLILSIWLPARIASIWFILTLVFSSYRTPQHQVPVAVNIGLILSVIQLVTAIIAGIIQRRLSTALYGLLLFFLLMALFGLVVPAQS